MKKTSLLTLPIIILLIISCSSTQTSEPFPYGSYFYRSYNFLGELVGEGTLYINQPDSTGVTGNWNIRKVRECNNCGAQFGSGFFMGSIEDEMMSINLNPDDITIDTKLTGTFGNGVFEGKWKWVNQEGFGYSGTFTANRQ